ncbi:MAG TPA: hypothetical protein VLA94_06825 [Syntrophales bacterium]|nr:hypothetical protein [Syntrophales bacterium]
MGKMKIVMTGALLSAALLTLSCASPMHLTDNWKSSAYTGPAYKNIMVVAMTKRIEMRQSVEDEFVRQLKSRGVEAAACHECIPDPDKVTREELINVSQGMGIEAYLIVRVLRLGTEVQSYQGQSPSPMAANTGRDSMVDMQWFGPEPSMGKRSDVATLESRIYDGKTSNLVWRSTVDAVNPYGNEEQVPRFVSLIVKTLGDNKLIN